MSHKYSIVFAPRQTVDGLLDSLRSLCDDTLDIIVPEWPFPISVISNNFSSIMSLIGCMEEAGYVISNKTGFNSID